VFADKPARRQLHDLSAVDRGVKAEVEVLQGLLIAESCRPDPSFNCPVLSQSDFIINNQFQKLQMAELVALGFL